MVVFFFFKQKTAYEMRISDWSSDVCSSDLSQRPRHRLPRLPIERRRFARPDDIRPDRGAVSVQARDQCGGRSARKPLWLAPKLVAGTATLERSPCHRRSLLMFLISPF